MPYSNVSYLGDGSTKTFSVPFPYISQSHVSLTVNGVAQTVTWTSSSQVQLATAPAVSTLVFLQRATPVTPLVSFSDGGTLVSTDLNTSDLQNLYVAQETIDQLVAVQATVNAVTTKVQVTPQMFGAKGDGVTDDTAAFVAAFASGARAIWCPAAIYLVKDVVIADHCIVYGNSSVFWPAPGAQRCVFQLTGFRPSLVDSFIDMTNGHLPVTLGVCAGVLVTHAVWPTVRDCGFTNGNGVCLQVGDNSGNQTTGGTFSALTIDTFVSRGILVQPNTDSCAFENIRIRSGTIPTAGGKQKAKDSAIGFQIVSTGSVGAPGGHFITDVDALGMGVAFQFTDAQLTTLENCIGDSVSGAAFQFTGTCSRMKLDNCYAGACLVGYEVWGSCTAIWITNPTICLIGSVTDWMDPAFYQTYSAATAFAIYNTADATIGGSWCTDHVTAYSIFVATTATVYFENDSPEHFGSTAASGAAVQYLVYGGSNSVESPALVAHKSGVVYGILAQVNTDPGVGKTFSYSVRKNFADSGFSALLTGNGSTFNASNKGLVFFNAGDNFDVAVTPSTGAAAALHRVVLKVRYFG